MKKLFNSSLFQIYIFILLFLIINVYLVFKVDIKNLFDSYIMIYLFWFLIIVLLKLMSHFIKIEDYKDVWTTYNNLNLFIIHAIFICCSILYREKKLYI